MRVSPSTQVKAARHIVTDPDQAQLLLLSGNKRFMNNAGKEQDITPAKRNDLLPNGQTPFAIIVSCTDSRVLPELIFDQGLGDLFVARAAGNVLDSVGKGGVEFAVKVWKRHSSLSWHMMNAVRFMQPLMAATSPKMTVSSMRFNPLRRLSDPMPNNTPNSALYEPATDANVEYIVARLKKNEHFKNRLDNKQPGIVGAKYYQSTGEVKFFQ